MTDEWCFSNPMGTEVKQSTPDMMLYEFFCMSVQTSDGKTFSWGGRSIKAIKQMIKKGIYRMREASALQ